MDTDLYTFERLLDYELNQSVRHRRYLSIVMFRIKDACKDLMDLLLQDVRQSDELFCYKDHFVILMGTTSKPDAITAVNRYGTDLEVCPDMCCSISSFPDDGKTSRELLSVLQQRLKKAMQLEPRALVAH